MADPFRLAIAVLAAGQSRRFGSQDKLSVPFRGAPLGLHASDRLARLKSETRFVVASRADHACAKGWEYAGLSVVLNPNAAEGMGTSVAIAARIARRAQCSALLIALADMPLVPLTHFRALATAAQQLGEDAVVASSNGNASMPPAVFGRTHFDKLADLSGDQGARDLLSTAETLTCPPDWLADIDTPEALAGLD